MTIDTAQLMSERTLKTKRLMSTPNEPTSGADSWWAWLHDRRFGDGDDTFKTEFHNVVQEIRERVLDGARLTPGLKLLDVRAGDGLIAFGSLQRVTQPFSVIFSDISAPLLAHAERLSKELGFREYCSFVQTSADELTSIADEAVDVLTTRAVLAYVRDKASAARNLLRVLRPGGRISLCEPLHQDSAIQLAALTNMLKSESENSTTPYLKLVQRFRGLQLRSDLAAIRSSPVTNFSERDLLRVFRGAGFITLNMELHIDVKAHSPMPWNTFINVAPLPGTPTLHEIFDQNFTVEEIALVERLMRGSVESGTLVGQSNVLYLTAEKP